MARVRRTVGGIAVGCALLGATGLLTGCTDSSPSHTSHGAGKGGSDGSVHGTAHGAGDGNRTLAQDGRSQYPRMIRLSHSGGANGRILASVTGRLSNGNSGGVVLESSDGGKSFHKLADAASPAQSAGHGTCCGSLYELPRKVGDMPEGTLLYAGSVDGHVPKERRRMVQRLWRSDDHGHTWRRQADIATAPNHEGGWEPELSVTADGRLAAFYSDETDGAHHSQKLVKKVSTDGVHWSRAQDLVVDPRQPGRPGMAIVRRLPGGGYFMAYEVCGEDPKHPCSIHSRTSEDGWDWGDPADLGPVVRGENGTYPLHTPNVAVSPQTGPHGTLVLVSQMLAKPDGSPAPGNGRTLLVNDRGGKGSWQVKRAPVAVHGIAQTDGVNQAACKNYSPSLLPSPDGSRVLEMTTDGAGKDGSEKGGCRAYVASGPLGGDAE